MSPIEVREKFIELRARGYSYEKISQELGKAKQTLIDWGKEYSEEIGNRKALELEALYEKYHLQKEARLQAYGGLLQRISTELGQRDLSEVPAGKLIELWLQISEKAAGEMIEPSFSSSEEMLEQQEAQQILQRFVGLGTSPKLAQKITRETE